MGGQCDCDPEDGVCRGCPLGKQGFTCAVSTAVTCLNGGAPNASGTGCNCPAEYADGGRCEFSRQCSFRGVNYSAIVPSVTVIGDCGCFGNWYGKRCFLCLCQNGGVCNAKGDCVCRGAFSGPQCQFCDKSCLLHGTCPPPVTIRQYNLRSCIAQFCDWDFIDNEKMCPECDMKWLRTTECSALTTFDACMLNMNCFFTTECVSINTEQSLPPPPRCECRGAWVGDYCDVCAGPAGSLCLPNGAVLGCDHNVYEQFRLAPAQDVCGVCGGDGNCVGCDGVVNSGVRFDACGVCNGTNGCLLAQGSAPVAVRFLFDVAPASALALPFESLMSSLAQGCDMLVNLTRTGQLLSPVRCIASDFQRWLVSFEGADYMLRNGNVTNATVLHHFARIQSRLSEAAFTSNNASDPSMTLAFTTTVVRLNVLTVSPNLQLYAAYTAMDAVARGIEGAMGGHARVLQTSEAWASAVAAAVSSHSLRFSAGVGLAAMFGLTAVFFGSLRFALIATVLAGFVLSGTLATATVAGWALDSTVQVCIAVVLAVASEHLVHLIDGYQDYVQTTQSHLFAKKTSRFHCVRGALVRTGLSATTSTVAVLLVSAMFAASEIQPFLRAAQIMITVHLLAMLAALFFCSWSCILGSTLLLRSPLRSLLVFVVLAACAGIILLAVSLSGGVSGPTGNRVL